MTSTRPALLIDVDGPLSPFAADPIPDGYTDHRIRLHPGWITRVRINPTHGPTLLNLPYDLTWATTWGGPDANKWLSPLLGLPELPAVPWVETHAYRSDGTYYKTWDIVAWADGRPFAWIDDEITDRDIDYVTWHHAGPALLHRVDPAIGLTDTDFTVLADWANALTVPQGA